MASVELHTLWLNNMLDLSDYTSFPFMARLTIKPAGSGELRDYAGGRRRVVTRPGRFVQASADLPACTREQLVWLEEHVNVPVLVRDDRGRKFYGIYFDVDQDEHQYNEQGDAALTIFEFSHDEAV